MPELIDELIQAIKISGFITSKFQIEYLPESGFFEVTNEAGTYLYDYNEVKQLINDYHDEIQAIALQAAQVPTRKVA